MRKLTGILFLLVALCFVGNARAAGTVVQGDAIISPTGGVKIVFTCTGDAANGSIPATVLTNKNMAAVRGLYFYAAKAYPTSGGTPPDAADLTVTMDGLDLLGGKGTNLIHATATQDVFPYSTFMSLYRYTVTTSRITIAVANQATVNANWTIELLFER